MGPGYAPGCGEGCVCLDVEAWEELWLGLGWAEGLSENMAKGGAESAGGFADVRCEVSMMSLGCLRN